MNGSGSPSPTIGQAPPAISLVIPAHNEEAHVTPLYEEIRAVLDGLGHAWELLVVNDGSTDETAARVRALHARDARVRAIDLDGNFGEAAALSAGFHAARGDIIVTMDGDGQNDPRDIPKLLAALAQPGIQVVSGRRVDRKEDALVRVWPSLLANALIARSTGLQAHDCGCGLKAYRRPAVKDIQLPRGMNRFLPAILGIPPTAFVEVATTDRPRRHGQSHYGIGRTLIVLRDLLALPFILHNPQRTEIVFALATAAFAGLAAAYTDTTRSLTIGCDLIALLCGLIWWNVRRFNRTQSNGAYRLRPDSPCLSASD